MLHQTCRSSRSAPTTSSTERNWRKVFRSARHVAAERGLVNLPQMMRLLSEEHLGHLVELYADILSFYCLFQRSRSYFISSYGGHFAKFLFLYQFNRLNA